VFVISQATADSDQVANNIARLAAEDIGQLGISTKLYTVDGNFVYGQLYLGQSAGGYNAYDMGYNNLFGTTDRLADPSTLLVRTVSTYANASFNYAGYNNTQYDQLYNQQLRELDLQKRKFLVDWMIQNQLQNAPHLTLGYPVQIAPINKAKVSGGVPYGAESLGNIWTYLNASSLVGAETFNVAVITSGVGDIFPATINFFTYTYRRTGLQSMIIGGLYDNLLRNLPSGAVVPSLATSWKFINSTNLVVRIRGDSKWTDGQPVTTQDVVFTFDYLIKTGQPAIFQPYLSSVNRMIVLNQTAVQFILKQPFAPFLTTTLTQIPILPQHIFDKLVEKQGVKNPSDLNLTPDLLVGSGPWKLVSFNYGSQVMFERNPYYYIQPHFKSIRFVYFTSPEVAINALEQGQIDTLASSQLLTPPQLQRLSGLVTIQLVRIPLWTYWHLHFNMRKLPGVDRAFRLALAHAINYERVASVAFGDLIVRGAGYIAPVNAAWVDIPLVMQMMKTVYSYDVAQARKILSDAGYQWDSQGRLHYPESLLSKGVAGAQADNYNFVVKQSDVISTVPAPQGAPTMLPAANAAQATPVSQFIVADQSISTTDEMITRPQSLVASLSYGSEGALS
jgi:peptide/nickel transport system substrate-binding protein